MITSIILAMELIRQVGTGELVPRAPRLENRPQYVPAGGFVGKPKALVPLDKLFRMPCISTSCRLYCHPSNIVMRPGWCSYYGVPEEGYLTLRIEE